jgi:hypothetical protein
MNDEEERSTPEELIRVFARCPNWPDDELGRIALAQGLARAERDTGMPREEIVERCAALSTFCPTDHDLLSVAQEMAATKRATAEAKAQETREAEWRKQYGAPQKFECDWSLVDVAEAKRKQAEMGRAIMKHLGISPNNRNPNRRSIQRVSWHDYFTAQRDLGYPLTPAQRKYL